MLIKIYSPKSVLIAFMLILILPAIRGDEDACGAKLVETIPIGMDFEQQLKLTQTHQAWSELIKSARKSIKIASFYWTLLCNDTLISIPESCSRGEAIFYSLVEALKREVKVEIAVNGNSSVIEKSNDLKILQNHGAQIVTVDFKRLNEGGILHTKFIIIDNVSFYLGSANMDWRSISEVKELGISITNCSQLTEDLDKIFQVYWILGQPNSYIPYKWPQQLETKFNINNPMKLKLNHEYVHVFLSSSPAQLNPIGRTNDIDAILNAINNSEKFVGIEVMEYSPSFVHLDSPKYWPVIDDALRRNAFEKPIRIHFLGSKWKYTRRNMRLVLKSLNQLHTVKDGGSVMAKMMIVPANFTQANVNFSRVNHCKFVVTDNLLYIGTSNWSADYFESTAGVGLTIIPRGNCSSQLRDITVSIFERDWKSNYSRSVYYQDV